MGLINWIFDFYQQYRIDEMRKETAQARAEAAAVRGADGTVDTARLERALGELALAVKTVQRTMIDKGVCTANEFHDRLKQLDLEDGKADGKAPVG